MKHIKRTAQKSGKSVGTARATSRASSSSSRGATRGRLGLAGAPGQELSTAMADALEDILRAERRSRMS